MGRLLTRTQHSVWQLPGNLSARGRHSHHVPDGYLRQWQTADEVFAGRRHRVHVHFQAREGMTLETERCNMRSLTQRSVLVAAGSMVLALSILAITPLAVRGDSYFPFCNFREVDATGRYYIVVKKEKGGPRDPGRGTPVSCELGERKSGSPSVEPAEDEFDFEAPKPNPAVKVREGDSVLARGKLKRCPRQILISSTGLGFVGLDVGGYNYGLRRSGDAVVIVAKDGTARHRKDLIDL